MTINELFKSFTDIEFQANRLMKMKVIDEQHLRQFDERSEEVRVQVLNLDLSERLLITTPSIKMSRSIKTILVK